MLIVDQYHLTVLAPRALTKPHRSRIGKALNRPASARNWPGPCERFSPTTPS
jgi:hypothetical protein